MYTLITFQGPSGMRSQWFRPPKISHSLITSVSQFQNTVKCNAHNTYRDDSAAYEPLLNFLIINWAWDIVVSSKQFYKSD